MLARLSRRRFVQTSVATGAAFLGSTRLVWSQPNGGGALRVRRNALELPADDPIFAKYAQAVKAMHELPAMDRRNWQRQAEIHADRCPHGQPGFLQWHRHYINFFEQICGQLIGDTTFALPYWDWSFGRGIIPDALFNLSDLNVTHWNDPGVYDSPVPGGWTGINTTGIRAIGAGVGVQDDPVRGGAFTSDTINSILNESLFSRFTGRLEGSPHNSGHVVVGFAATATGHMGSGLSPLDPLFWLHHCNVDRLWAQWQLAGNQTPDLARTYSGHFVDGNGQSANVTADQARDFTSLGYTYEQFSEPERLIAAAGLLNPNAAPNLPLLARLKPRELENEARTIGEVQANDKVEVGIPASFPVSVQNLTGELSKTSKLLDWSLPTVPARADADTPVWTAERLQDFGRPRTAPRRILANLRNVQGSFERDPIVNVFVNCPYLAPETPYSDIHWAGTFAFFGASQHADGQHAHDGGRDFYVDLTRALSGINLADAGEIKVQLMAVPPSPESPIQGSFQVGSIEILSV